MLLTLFIAIDMLFEFAAKMNNVQLAPQISQYLKNSFQNHDKMSCFLCVEVHGVCPLK